METSEIENLINSALELDELHVKFDGSQCKVIAIADMFGELSRVKKQQVVYAPLAQVINDGVIHAVTIKTFTTSEWQREKMFNLPL
ncbi:BolA family protein [Thalassomonas haliotis]|uniref:BolA/IbaG family iron-sulfur metabolism protein n=1 Tax=Thalassomonas haliotis TaxID=485448 RepID=A0ABY7VBZ9_9GAMM|nr:BolA/IbaG family iron-sulfur metabolism protein [Thalassomonas haliotis]WDE10875.1 BolA/IbaG family iron-sulfur metabolism protein [Thalassomonas haliotis]